MKIEIEIDDIVRNLRHFDEGVSLIKNIDEHFSDWDFSKSVLMNYAIMFYDDFYDKMPEEDRECVERAIEIFENGLR